jgi:hypothetical protein
MAYRVIFGRSMMWLDQDDPNARRRIDLVTFAPKDCGQGVLQMLDNPFRLTGFMLELWRFSSRCPARLNQAIGHHLGQWVGAFRTPMCGDSGQQLIGRHRQDGDAMLQRQLSRVT